MIKKLKNKTMNQLLQLTANITRRFHPRGTERFLRLFCNPDTTLGFDTVAVYDGIKIHVNPKSFIEWVILFKGNYEQYTTDIIKKYFIAGGTFVDVGANIGVHTLIAARIGKVIAFEPVPANVERLKQNIELNGFTNIIIRQAVVSDSSGVVTLHVVDDSNKSATIYDLSDRKQHSLRSEAITLDEELKEQRVDFIKIDTDGNDRNVLMGAKEIIRKNHPIIIFEDSEATISKYTRNDVDEMLSGFGYKQIKVSELDTLCI